MASTKGKQLRIPGTVNNIEELDALALQYAAVRDERMALGKQEGDLKDKVHACMNAHKLKTYKYGEITIELVPVDEDVKVKVAAPKEQKPEDPVNISVGMTDREFENVPITPEEVELLEDMEPIEEVNGNN